MSIRDAGPTALQLTDRQRQVLEMLRRGKTNPQIADALGISLPGAKWHVSEVMNKLGVASREEAVEAWQAHQRSAARTARFARGLLSFGMLKWAAIGGGAAATAISAAVAVSVLRPAEPEEEPRASLQSVAPPPASLLTGSQAEERAKDLAVQVMAPYSPHLVPPADEARWRAERERGVPGGPTMYGRPVEASDLVVLEARFLSAAATVETNVIGRTLTFDSPRDVWVVRLATQPPWEPVRPTEATHLVVFEDGGGELIAGGLIGDLPVRTADPATADYSEAVALAEFDAGTTTFWLYAFPPRFGRPMPEGVPASYVPRAGEVCLGTVDSRMPGGVGGGCLVPALDPVSNPMEASVHNSQGFAHANGLVAENVVRVRAVTEDGREVTVAPGPYVEGLAFRGFIAAAPGPEWFILIQALDAEGNVIDSSDASNHPTNPPPPGATHTATP